jgi:hypothetical protein
MPNPAYVDMESKIQETRAKYDEALQPFNRSAPRPFPEETHDEYRRRALPILQNYAPEMKEINVYDARSSAFDMIERQTFSAAKREAYKPTNIPDGELKEVRRYDQAGRPFYEFYGKPSVWMDIFSATKKRLAGIRIANERGYHPSNVG